MVGTFLAFRRSSRAFSLCVTCQSGRSLKWSACCPLITISELIIVVVILSHCPRACCLLKVTIKIITLFDGRSRLNNLIYHPLFAGFGRLSGPCDYGMKNEPTWQHPPP